MKNVLLMAVLAVAALFVFSGCLAVSSPTFGAIYTNTKGPVGAGDAATGSKEGRAEAISVLGLVAVGDASIDTAAKSVGITKIYTVDHEAWSILGIYGKYTTIVRGE